MVTKRGNGNFGVIDDLGPDPEPKVFKIFLSTTILGISLLIITVFFFYAVSRSTGGSFGLQEILFSIVVTVVSLAILRWIRLFMTKNPYLGVIIGLGLLGSAMYGIRQRYSGPNTNLFVISISLIILAYLLYHFWKSRR